MGEATEQKFIADMFVPEDELSPEEKKKQAKALAKQIKKRNRISWKSDICKNWPVYLLFLPVLAWLVVFHYVPMTGIVLAFKDYNIWDGIWGSKWCGFDNFTLMFTGGGTGSNDFLFALRNTVVIGLLNLTIGFIVPVIFALLVSQVRVRKYKRVCQMLSYLPNFVSAVVIVQLMQNLLGQDGPLTILCVKLFGAENIDWTNAASPAIWIWYVIFGTWQGFGYGSITFVSAISNIDGSLYEAAAIDGASRWQMMKNITLPAIMPMILMMWILQIGMVFKIGFDRTQLLYNASTNAEYIDTLFSYTMRNTLSNDLGLSTASSLFQSVVGTILLVTGNTISRKVGGVSMV